MITFMQEFVSVLAHVRSLRVCNCICVHVLAGRAALHCALASVPA